MENSAIERVLGGSKPILRPILVSDVRKTLQISHETAQK
jgi:hypothetical protein